MSKTSQIFSRIAPLALLLPLLLGAAENPEEEAFLQPDVKLKMMTVKIASVSKTKLVVDQFNIDHGLTGRVTLIGHIGVPVSGKKGSWLELRKGDLIAVTFEPDTKKVVKVDAMKWTDHPKVAQTIGMQRTGKPGRVFMGWVKLRTDDAIVVRTPDAAPPSKNKGKSMRFLRNDGTVVEKLRDSWSDVKKGDRVKVHYGKGRPRPAERVVVTLRGGEKPLPPGLPTRLYDPKYDKKVKDVDGIGEIAPGEEWRPDTETANAS